MKYNIETAIAKIKFERSIDESSFNDMTRNIDVFNDILEILEKQIPKKPIGVYDRTGGYAECPHCHIEECRGYDDDEFGYGGGYIQPKHCAECGGLLDWSEE